MRPAMSSPAAPPLARIGKDASHSRDPRSSNEGEGSVRDLRVVIDLVVALTSLCSSLSFPPRSA
jgi:hypothetical protein